MLLPLLQESSEMVHFGSKCSKPREGGKKMTASTETANEGVITCIIREDSRNCSTKTHTTILR
jgi:hypothetical protein